MFLNTQYGWEAVKLVDDDDECVDDDQDEDYEDDGDVDRGLKLRGEEAVKQVQ